MNLTTRTLGITAFCGLMPIIAGAQEESPDYGNTQNTAEPLIVPYRTDGSGVTVTGGVRLNGNLDTDWFRFSNDHRFGSMVIKITPTSLNNPSGNPRIDWMVVGGSPEPQSGQFTQNRPQTVTVRPAPGATVHIKIEGITLTGEQGQGTYEITVVGLDGTDPTLIAVQEAQLINDYNRANKSYKKYKKKYKKLKKNKKKRKTKSGKKKLKKYKKKYKKYKKRRDSYRRQLAAL